MALDENARVKGELLPLIARVNSPYSEPRIDYHEQLKKKRNMSVYRCDAPSTKGRMYVKPRSGGQYAIALSGIAYKAALYERIKRLLNADPYKDAHPSPKRLRPEDYREPTWHAADFGKVTQAVKMLAAANFPRG